MSTEHQQVETAAATTVYEEQAPAQYTTTTTYTNPSAYTTAGATQYAGLAVQYTSQPQQYQYAIDGNGQYVLVPATTSYGNYGSQYTQNADGSWSVAAAPAYQQYPYSYQPNYTIAAGGGVSYPGATIEEPK